MKKSLLCIMLCCLLLTTACQPAPATSFAPSDSLLSFWERIGIDHDDITSVQLLYKQYSSTMGSNTAKQFLDMLSTAEPVSIEDTHEYIPSDFLVRFLSEDNEITVTFYWFTFRRDTASSAYCYATEDHAEYTDTNDDRFDIKIDNTIYHYRLRGDAIWNDELNRSSFNKGDCDLMVWEIDGYEKETVGLGYAAPAYQSVQEILDYADAVVVAKAVKTQYVNPMESVVIFRTIRQLKGSTGWFFTVNRISDEVKETNMVRYCLPIDPPYINGETYLLCLCETRSPINTDIRLGEKYFSIPLDWDSWCPATTYCTAIVTDSVLYPRFNTEHHPLAGLTVQEIKDLLNE